jgi:hypothetical protein
MIEILWGNTPPAHVLNPTPAQCLYINDDLCPGLCTLSGGTRGNNYRLEQEPRTFTTYVYYSGFRVPAWKASFQIWTQEQYEEAVRLHNKYSPHPVKQMVELVAREVTNPILRENGYHAMLVNDWSPMAAPVEGMSYVYTQAYKRKRQVPCLRRQAEH